MSRFGRTRKWGVSMAVVFGLTAFFVLALVAGIFANGTPDAIPGQLSDLPEWFRRPPNPWFVINAGLSALGALSALAGFLGTKPVTGEHVEKIVESSGDRIIDAFNRDKHERALEEIESGKASPELLARYRQLLELGEKSEQSATRQDFARAAAATDALDRSSLPAEREIAKLVDEGKPLDAARALAKLADSSATDTDTKSVQAERLREAAELVQPFSPTEAMGYLERAAQLDPEHFWTWIKLSRLQAFLEMYPAARQSLKKATPLAGPPRYEMVLHHQFGLLMQSQGQCDDAISEFKAALAVAERTAELHPENAAAQADLLLSHEQLGNAQMFQSRAENIAGKTGDPAAGAYRNYASQLSIAKNLAARDPGNRLWQEYLARSYYRIAEAETFRLDFSEARRHYDSAITVYLRLAERYSKDAAQQLCLGETFEALGEMEERAGQPDAAREALEVAIGIRQRLVEHEPENGQRLKQLRMVLAKLARIEVNVGNEHRADELIGKLEALLPVRKRLADSDPDISKWQHALAAVHLQLASLEADVGGYLDTQAKFEGMQSFGAFMEQRDPAQFARDALARKEQLAAAKKHLSQAEEHYAVALGILKRVADQDLEIDDDLIAVRNDIDLKLRLIQGSGGTGSPA